MKRVLAFLLAALLAVAAFPSLAADEAETEERYDTAYTTQKYGDSGPRVADIQERLTQLGYYAGKISGSYLGGTRSCVKRFQKDYGLEQTGEADEATYELLMTAQYRTLKNGDDGTDTGRLQERLIELGYLNTNVTNKFRSATEGAVKAFQRQNGLEATGIADPDTQKALFGDNALAKGVEPTPTPNPLTDVGDTNDVVMANDGSEDASVSAERPYETTLRRGDQGATVKAVQTRLKELGFFDGPISGYYMNQTLAAVGAFQEHNGLYADQVLGEETWNALFNDPEVVGASATPKPSPVPTIVPYAVTVDVRNQVTTVYSPDENGEYTQIVRQMICSTGSTKYPSDVGDWVTNGKRARWAYFSLYGSHAQYWTRINEYIAFHSVIYTDVDYMKLSVNSYNRLGRRGSHGCVRLLVSDAKWVYDNIRKGVVVTITEDLPEDQELAKSLMPPPLDTTYMVPAATPLPTPEPSYTPDGMPPQPFRKMSKGSEGADVYWLQRKLKDLGYYQGTVTGAYWNGTAAAVRAYRRDNKLPSGTAADTKMLTKLYADVLAANEPTPEPTFTPEPTPEPAQTEITLSTLAP